MLFKTMESHKGADDWKYVLWRYWCECMDTRCVLEFTEDHDTGHTELEIGLNTSNQWSMWRRLKACWSILRGKEVRLSEVVISDKDRKELGAAIAGKYDEYLLEKEALKERD